MCGRRLAAPVHLLAAQTRAGRIETRHFGHAVVLDRTGRTLAAWGDPGHATYWRSAAKPVQAATVVASGAWDALGLDEAALAVASGSHAGEPQHREAVQRVLAALGCDPDHLLCGVHRPWSRHSVRPATGPDALGNNCSGKHAAMLAACVHHGWSRAYLHADHPLQQQVAARAGVSLESSAPDGCGVPTFYAPLDRLASAFQQLEADEAGTRVLDAMADHPAMVAGTGQFCSDLGRATRGAVIGKYGALGVYAALHRESGQALALKVEDGDARAAKAAAARIMELMGWLDEAALEALLPHRMVPNRTNDGQLVGELASTLGAQTPDVPVSRLAAGRG